MKFKQIKLGYLYDHSGAKNVRICNPDYELDFSIKEIRQNSREALEQSKKLISEISI